MHAALYREQARRVLESGDYRAVLPPRAALLWATHDYGLMGFQEERLDETLRAALRRLLGERRRGSCELAACPVTLLYGLAGGGLSVSADARAGGTLPGNGMLTRVAGSLICLSQDPCACLSALVVAEETGRGRLLGRVLGDDVPSGLDQGPVESGMGEGSCGRCGGLLGGAGHCAGTCCVNHGTT